VTSLRKHVLGLAQAEAQRISASVGNLDERTKKAIFDLADGLAKKLLHQPQMALRQDDGDGVPLVLAVQRLFKLEVADVAAGEVEEAEAGQSRGSSSARPSPSREERNPSEGSDVDESKKAAGR
jgi:hypothetical protein